MTTKVREAEKAYTIAQVAELKGVSQEFVRRAVRATGGNILAAKRVGKGYRISASAIEAWWAAMEDV